MAIEDDEKHHRMMHRARNLADDVRRKLIVVHRPTGGSIAKDQFVCPNAHSIEVAQNILAVTWFDHEDTKHTAAFPLDGVLMYEILEGKPDA